MENITMRRQQSQRIPPPKSGRLLRSKSGSSLAAGSITLPENNSNAANTSQRSMDNRSKSVMKSRTKKKDEENVNPLSTISTTQNKKANRENQEHLAKYLRLGYNIVSSNYNNVGVRKEARSARGSTSPSAWALSPGRSLGFLPTPPESPGSGGRQMKSCNGGSAGGGVKGVFKYFKKNKVSRSQELELHKFRVLHNRMLQWRFANARAEAAMINVKTITEDKVFSACVRSLRMRNSIVEKRIQLQKVKNEIKLYRIIYPQISLLNECAKFERRNQESVGKLVTTLSGLSIRIPLLHGAKADMESVHAAMSMAVRTMDSIDAVITKHLSEQLEKVLYMLTERLSMLKEREECLEELEKAICLTTSLVAKENSERVGLMQALLKNLSQV